MAAFIITPIADGKVEILTPRLLLRGAREADAEDLFECFRNEDVMRYWDTLHHDSIEPTRKWLAGMIAGALNGVTDFVICIKPELKVIGKIGIWRDHEIGFLLAREWWGKGLAAEALRTVLPYFCGERGHERIVADVDPRNMALIGILRKFGFEVTGRQERTVEVGGVWMDSVYLTLEREKLKL